MNNLNRTIFIFILIAIASCSPKVSFKKLPAGPIKHQLIVLAKVSDAIRVKGFSGATPAKTSIICRLGQKNSEVESKPDGSFDLSLKADNIPAYAELTFTPLDGKPHVTGYKVKDLDQALKDISKEAFTTGKEIDDLSFVSQKALILSSNAASVSVFDMGSDWVLDPKPKNSILLNPKAGPSVGAGSIAAFKNHALVPFSLTHELALLDLVKNKLVSKTQLLDSSGKRFMFENKPALRVNSPINADGRGPKTEIALSFAHSPEAVFALGNDHFLASFTNYYQFSDEKNNSVVGPGIVALLAIENGELVSKHIEVLNFKNPMYFFAADKNNVWITCAGAWNKDLEGGYKSQDAGLVKLQINADKNRFAIKHEIALNNFSPVKPIIIGNQIVIPHSQQNEIAVINDTATKLTSADIKTSPYPSPFSFSFASHWHDDIIMLGDYNGSLVAYSLSEGFFPFPFVEPIRVAKEEGLRPRLHKLFYRHQVEQKRIEDLTPGYSAWAVSFTQAKIFPLDFLAVFGP